MGSTVHNMYMQTLRVEASPYGISHRSYNTDLSTYVHNCTYVYIYESICVL